MVEPPSMESDIHELLEQALNWTTQMFEINDIIKDFPKNKYGRNYAHIKNTEERREHLHKIKHIESIIRGTDTLT